MRNRVYVLSVAALAVTLAAPAQADVRIQERLTTLNSDVSRWTMVKGGLRSVVTRAQTVGPIYDAGARHGLYVEVARPDRELIYQIDPQEKSYREITEPQFKKLLQRGIQLPRDANQQPLRSSYTSQTTAIEVVPTGKTKKIAGFDTEQLIARLVVGAQNVRTGKDLRFTFDQEVWITRDERLVNEIRAAEDAQVDVFGTAATLSQVEVMAGEWNDPFVNHIRALNDRVRALGGYPLSVSTTVLEEALAQSKDEKSTARRLNVMSGEVVKISLDTIPAHEFEVPVGYINSDTKIAAAPVATPTSPEMTPTVPPVRPTRTARTDAATPPGGTAGEKIASGSGSAVGMSAATPVVAAPPMERVASAPPVTPTTAGPAGAPTRSPGTGTPRGTGSPTPPVPAPPVRTPPVVVTTAPPVVTTGTLPDLGTVRTNTPPPPVVIDELDTLGGKKKRRK